MKKLLVYKENDEFVIERVNEFNHSTKHYFITEEGLKEGLDAYDPVIHEYALEVSKELWAMVINHLGRERDYS